MNITLNVHIPAISELAAALNNLAEAQRGTRVHLASGTVVHPGTEDNRAIPVTEDVPTPPSDEPAPAKRTRRTKAEMDEARKIEETTGRRVDLGGHHTPVDVPTRPDTSETQAEDAAAEQGLAEELANDKPPFKWTVPLLKDTFIAPITDNDLRNELIEIRKKVDPHASALATMKENKYDEFAEKAKAWYAEKGLELTLPEGAE